ncbi:Cof-type HAD-IIB family hydrolase [Streptococcus sanguinis]|uniref:Cof-type HAD-IIB family hydrolase n=1 Tax=Streptococcus sanguinis TaxID=1305 RepID=UPI001CBAEDB9|nr:Cof-type HAD-IIB family hydrolase [Streptococcus sanguinis]MBZ2066504.1 Cof-type HAD-IIB family hydrolase [Streptococcus sanguinis]
MTIKRIFCDMDGTLLNSQGRLTDSNAKLISQANLPFTLVSARAPMEMKEAINKLELTGPQIGFNGGLIYTYKQNQIKILHQQALERNDSTYLVNFINQHFPHLSQSYYDLENWYTYKMDNGIDYEQQLTRLEATIIGEEKYLKVQTSIFKIMLITFDGNEMRALKAKLEELDLPNVSIQQAGDFYLEITHKKAKKSVGIDYIIKEEKLHKKELVAFGDGHNDLPMFERVGLSIAMENASQAIKDKVSLITKTNDEDGVGYGIHHFLL